MTAALLLGLLLSPLSQPVGHGEGAAVQPALEDVAERFASAWSSGDVGRLSGLLSGGAIRFYLGRDGHDSLSPRQALASVREVLQGRRSRSVQVTHVSEVGGSPARGFAEISWEVVADGTSEPVRYTLFVGFVMDAGRWAVSEIRVLR